MQVLVRICGKSPLACGLAFSILMTQGVGSAGAESGREIFETNCAVCHGIEGTAILPNAPHFLKGERMEKADDALLASVSEGLNQMPPWGALLKEQEIREVLTYIRSLAK